MKIKLTVEMTYNRGAKVAKNGNDLKAKHMSKSRPCPACGGPKSYRAELCRQCNLDELQVGAAVFWQRVAIEQRRVSSHHRVG